MATEQPPSDRPSTIETASERLDAFLKNRDRRRHTQETALVSSDGDPHDLSSDERTPPTPDDDARVTRGEEVSRQRSFAPRWLKVALAVVLAIAMAEGAYITWRLREAPASVESGIGTPPSGVGHQDSGGRPTSRSGASPIEAQESDVETGDAQPLAPDAVTGSIEVRTSPSGATVVFGGQRQGVTPLTIPDVAPGVHEVEVGGWFGSRTERIVVRAGETSLVALDVPARRLPP